MSAEDSQQLPDLVERVHAVLTGLGYHPDRVPGSEALVVEFTDSLLEGALAQVLSEDSRFVFYIDFREQVPEPRRASVSEFIARANSGLIIGNYEIELSDGMVRVKVSIDYEDGELTPVLVRNCVRAAQQAAAVYGQELMHVAQGEKAPAAAIADAEKAANL